MWRGSSRILTARVVFTTSLLRNTGEGKKEKKRKVQVIPEAGKRHSLCECEVVNSRLLVTSAEKSGCSVKEVGGFVDVQHGRQKAADALVRDALVKAGAAADKYEQRLTY